MLDVCDADHIGRDKNGQVVKRIGGQVSRIFKMALFFCAKHHKLISGFLLLLIAAGSLSPVEQLPDVPGSDKTHHVLAYALLMLPTGLAKPRYWWLWAMFFLCCSGAIELLQPYVNRFAQWLDLLANSVGLLCGFIIGMGLRRIFAMQFVLSKS